ncbi:MAG: hypothetical protein J5824_09020 [Lachnospiraceae bacterium]|nr:hypothetical protein [Lachnospiraceae bacterium]
MYKLQMRFQKIICYVALASGVLVFVYSLGLMTDLYDSLYFMMPEVSEPELDKVAGARIYYDMQDFNRSLTRIGIILILLALFILIMNTHVRRRYYAGNYIAAGAFCAAGIFSSVWSVKRIMEYKDQYLTTVDFETLKMRAEIMDSYYTESTFWFDVCKPVFGILLLAVALLAFNLVWKIKVENEEKKLIAQGKEAVSNE